MKAAIAQLDTAATASNALAGEPSGYDRVFREPVNTDAGSSLVYKPPVMVPCQVQTEVAPWGQLRQWPGGREIDYDMRIALHYADLETRGLVRPDGYAVFQPSDILVGVYRSDGVTMLHDFSARPLYCEHVRDRSWGLSGLHRNLVVLYFKDRTQGTPA